MPCKLNEFWIQNECLLSSLVRRRNDERLERGEAYRFPSHAGAANLKTIKRHCSNGKLATREIGEMLELEAMSQLDPEDTIIESLIVHEKEREFEISYRVRSSTWYDVREEAVFFSIALALTFIFVVVMLIVNLEIAKSLRAKGSPIYHSTGSLNTSHRYAIDL